MVGLLDFPLLTNMLELLFALLNPALFLLVLPFPFFFLRFGVEEGLDLVVVMMALELLLAHVGMSNAELLELHVSVVLLIFSLSDLLG